MLNQLPHLKLYHQDDHYSFENMSHLLYINPELQNFENLNLTQNSYLNQWLKNIIQRKNFKIDDLKNTSLSGDFHHTLTSFLFLNTQKSTFDQHTALRKAIKTLLDENPTEIYVMISPLFSDIPQIKAVLEKTIYTIWVNSAPLPSRKKDQKPPKLNLIHIIIDNKNHKNFLNLKDFEFIGNVAESNILTRTLTLLPSNELTAKTYQHKIIQFAEKNNILYKIYDIKQLQELKAGAFLAVAQASPDESSSIIHLKYRPQQISTVSKRISLVGKGICFDTGGHQLKPAKYMQQMNYDMNGSAVALGILNAVSQLQLPIEIDVWLAISDNYLNNKAYKPQDVITACNGTTIEIIHTDAEGRMVLADTLTLASRENPDILIDFATLTGSCVDAVGTIYSGLFCNHDKLTQLAIEIAKQTGERLCAFPLDDDYTKQLDSDIADIKQCTLDSEADHILGAKFLQKFIENEEKILWIHIDLSASTNKDGLGAIESEVTGFGVHWGIELINQFVK